MASDARLPLGLHECSKCGAIRGTTRELPDDWDPEEEGDVITSTCFCEGLECSGCGRRRIRRPISDYYDPEYGEWSHVPHFAAMRRRCMDCV